MNKSRATKHYHEHLHHQNALLQLLTLHHYRELCYQMYLVGLALAEYNAANKVTAITTDEGTTTFAYDMNDHRYRKTTDESTTTYIDKVYEHIDYHDYGFTEDRYYVYAGDKVIAVSSQYHGRRYENETRYLHHDALGSVDTITNSQGEVVERSLYKPFGEHLRLYTKPDSRSITNRGYTGHEEIEDSGGLVHMNARIYDPTLGRFMSADTLIQDPYDMQTYNRYSYVRNNPLKYTDPSGHSFWSIIKSLITVAIVAVVGAAVLGAFGLTAASATSMLTMGGMYTSYAMTALITSGAIAGFAGGVVGALLEGASPGQALIAGLQGFVLGGLTAGISNKIGNISSIIGRAISHGIVSGIRAIVQGGNFLSGFLSSFASTILQPIGQAIAKGNYYARATFSAIVGGTVSVIGGGKFANGAVTSAFQFMYNEWLHVKGTSQQKDKVNQWLKNIKTHPKFRKMIEAMKASGYEYSIEFNDYESSFGGGRYEPSNRTVYLHTDYLDDNQKVHGYWVGGLFNRKVVYYKGEIVLVHELLGHGYDHAMGVLPSIHAPIAVKENHVIRLTNTYRDYYGLPHRGLK